MALFNANMMIEVHVLLVGHDVVSLLETSQMLELNSYKVTAVRPMAASSMLTKEKVKYDVVMVDVSSSDVQVFQLAHDAIDMGYTVILMSDDPNMGLMKCAIEDGAFMFIQKPATMEVLKYLWQHVLRENARKAKESAKFREMVRTMQSSNFLFNGTGGNIIHPNNFEANIDVYELGSRNLVYRKGGLENDTRDKSKKPKICTEWNQELHEKFIEAVKELGEGRCFPRDILELMNVPGLKRMQVASHLQKCRQGWKPNQESNQHGSVSSKSDDSNRHSKPKRHGSYPRIAKGAQPKFLVRNKERNEQAPPTKVVEDSTGSLEPNNMTQNNVSSSIDNMKQNIERSANVSNNLVMNVNEIPSNNVDGETAVESNHKGRTFPFDDSLDFALDNFDGVDRMDYNFEGFGLDQIFPQTSAVPDEEPGSFWRSFLSNFESHD